MSQGTARPIDSGTKDSLGRTVKVSAGAAERSVTAPSPMPVEVLDDSRWLNTAAWAELVESLPPVNQSASYVIVAENTDSSPDVDVFDGDGPVEVLPIGAAADYEDMFDPDEIRESVEMMCVEAAGITNPQARDSYLNAVRKRAGGDETGVSTRIVDACRAAPVRPVHHRSDKSFVDAVSEVGDAGLTFTGIDESDHDGHPMLHWETPNGQPVVSRYVDYDDESCVEYAVDGSGWSEDRPEGVGDDDDDDEGEFEDAVREAHFGAYWAIHDRTKPAASTARSALLELTRPVNTV